MDINRAIIILLILFKEHLYQILSDIVELSYLRRFFLPTIAISVPI